MNKLLVICGAFNNLFMRLVQHICSPELGQSICNIRVW